MKFAGFRNSDFFFFRVDDEESVREFLHVFDAAEVFLKFFHFMFEERNFFLRQEFERAIFGLFFQCLQAFYALFDGLEVGEHTAEPAFVDEVLVAAFCFVFNGFLGLFFRAYEEDFAAFSSQVADKIVSFVHFLNGFLQVDDVDTVTFGEDETSHLRVPTAGLMTEMNAGFQ